MVLTWSSSATAWSCSFLHSTSLPVLALFLIFCSHVMFIWFETNRCRSSSLSEPLMTFLWGRLVCISMGQTLYSGMILKKNNYKELLGRVKQSLKTVGKLYNSLQVWRKGARRLWHKAQRDSHTAGFPTRRTHKWNGERERERSINLSAQSLQLQHSQARHKENTSASPGSNRTFNSYRK